MRSFRIGRRRVGPGEPCYVIAEAGSNHDKDLRQALRLIDVAAGAGADAVKFQAFTADKIAAKTRHPIAEINFAGARSLHELYGQLELPLHWLPELRDRARHQGVHFLCTPFDEASVDALDRLGTPAFKISSFEMVHTPLLRHVATKGKPVLLSTGMARLGEIEQALDALRSGGLEDVALLHCTSNYPASFGSVNLRAMDTMAAAFQLPVGYSDHTLGISVGIAVAARGGSILEKHFTTDRGRRGPDHSFAVEPDELGAMVKGMRDVEAALGTPQKRPAREETVPRQRGRRSLFASRELAVGHVLRNADVAVLRPGVGLAPDLIDVVVGRRLSRPARRGDPITWDHFFGDRRGEKAR